METSRLQAQHTAVHAADAGVHPRHDVSVGRVAVKMLAAAASWRPLPARRALAASVAGAGVVAAASPVAARRLAVRGSRQAVLAPARVIAVHGQSVKQFQNATERAAVQVATVARVVAQRDAAVFDRRRRLL